MSEHASQFCPACFRDSTEVVLQKWMHGYFCSRCGGNFTFPNSPATICQGCGRPELHKSCPAYGTKYYMSGVPYTVEVELSLWQQYASYCNCCAISGEHDVTDFRTFVASLKTQGV